MISPADIGRGLQETSDRFFWMVGFLFTVAVLGGIVNLRFGKKYRQLQRDLKRSRWKTLYR